jgi:hypothetical protein
MLIENLIGVLNNTPLTVISLADLTDITAADRSHLGQISLFNLATAIVALQIGVPGRLTIEVPSRVDGRIEVDWQPTRTTPK